MRFRTSNMKRGLRNGMFLDSPKGVEVFKCGCACYSNIHVCTFHSHMCLHQVSLSPLYGVISTCCPAPNLVDVNIDLSTIRLCSLFQQLCRCWSNEGAQYFNRNFYWLISDLIFCQSISAFS